MKSRKEVNRLKAQWLEDPCWDIEDTEGFEDYKEELKRFRSMQEMKWKRMEELQLQDKAILLGVPGNTALARYVLQLEDRIEMLTWQIENMKSSGKLRKVAGFLALAMTFLFLLPACSTEVDCRYDRYDVQYVNVAGQVVNRQFLLPENIYKLAPQVRDGGYVLEVESECGNHQVAVGVIDLIRCNKLTDGTHGEFLDTTNLVMPVDTNTMLTY